MFLEDVAGACDNSVAEVAVRSLGLKTQVFIFKQKTAYEMVEHGLFPMSDLKVVGELI